MIFFRTTNVMVVATLKNCILRNTFHLAVQKSSHSSRLADFLGGEIACLPHPNKRATNATIQTLSAGVIDSEILIFPHQNQQNLDPIALPRHAM